jgi:hypothetical protein
LLLLGSYGGRADTKAVQMQQHHCWRQHAAAACIMHVTWSMCTALQLRRHHLLLLPAYLRHTYTLQSLARGKEALLAPKSPLSVIKAATPEQQQQAAAPKPQQQQQQSLLSTLAMSARRLLRQGTWVGTDVPAFNGASMGWYQGECLQPTTAVSVQAPPAAGQRHSRKDSI